MECLLRKCKTEISTEFESDQYIGMKYQRDRDGKNGPHNHRVERTAAAVMSFANQGQNVLVLTQRSRRPVLPLTRELYGRN